MVPSMYELTSAGLKNKTGWPGCYSGKSLVLGLLSWCFFGLNSVLLSIP